MTILLRYELFILPLLNYCFLFPAVQSITTVTGSKVQIMCSNKVQSDGIIIWTSLIPNPLLPLSENTKIYDTVPTELRQRMSITGDHSNGEYNLVISDVKKTDGGLYKCEVYGDSSKEQTHQLVVIEGPTSVTISNKLGNTFPGTEDHDLTIRCTANGGDPAPNMKLMLGNESYTVTNKHAIERTISKVSRSYDSVTVTCQSAYDGVTYTPQTDTAVLRLSLKPLRPFFSINPVVTESTKYLVLTCTSTGSRPAPTDRIWLIGDSNVDITSSSTSVSSSQQSDGTYVATSTLTYKVNKGYNQKLIKCGFKNTASGNNYIQGSTTVNVMYAPDVSVRNKTFTLIQSSREIQCVVNGNPASSFFKWQHKSNYGELVREFDGSSTLVLPIQSEEDRYQDTGEYVCTASNGIRDEEGNLDQRGSGYVISQAPTRFLYGSSQIKLGQYGKDVDIDISVYSVPKHQTPTWLRRDISLSQSKKYTMSEETQIITYTFYGNLIRADGFTLTLTIRNLSHQDFDNYTLKLSNGVGETVEHSVILKAFGPPDEPYNFTYIDVTESAVTLQWLPGYDGGHEQTFVIQYRIKDLKVWNEKQVSKYDLFSSVGSNIFTLTGLDAGKLYEIRMYSRNKIGRSLSSDIQTVSTRCSVCDVERNSVTGVAVGLSIVTVISLISNGILAYKLLHAKKMLSGNSSKNRSVDRKSYPEVYYNITDDKEDTDQRSELEVRQYKTMGTKDKPNVYEGLDHEIRTDKEHFGKGEDYETLGTKEKSNVYEELDQKPNDSTSKIYSSTLI